MPAAESPAAPFEHDDPADFNPLAWKRALRERDQPSVVAPLVSKAAAEETTAELPIPLSPRKKSEPSPQFLQEAEAEAGAKPAPKSDAEPETEPTDSRFDDAPAFELSRLPDDDEVLAEQKASFVIQAERKAFWKRPLVRVSMLLLMLVLSALLALQWTLLHKDQLAVREPRLVPWLQTLCVQLNCTLAPPRQIESLTIDSSTFTKTGNDTYRLGFTLKNTSNLALQVPSLEVTLTDSQDRPVVRRVLLPTEFGVKLPTLAGRSELAGSVSLKVSSAAAVANSPSSSSSPAAQASSPLRVAGYRILAFYP